MQTLGAAPPAEPFPAGFAQGAYRVGPGIVGPSQIAGAQPDYPDDAKAEKIVGDVEVLLVIQADGTVEKARAVTSLSPRLDAEAVRAARQYRFTPATLDGKPIAVVATLFVTFNLPGEPKPRVVMIGGTADPPAGVELAPGSAVQLPGPGLLRPLPISKVYPAAPPNPPDAPGQVQMLAVVRPDGRLDDIKVIKGMGAAFDTLAVDAIRRWTFEPAIKNGVAVPMLMAVFIQFSKN